MCKDNKLTYITVGIASILAKCPNWVNVAKMGWIEVLEGIVPKI